MIEVVLTYQGGSQALDPAFSIIYSDGAESCTKDTCCNVLDSSSCVDEVGRPIANERAAIVGDEARKELARLTKQPRNLAADSSGSGSDGPDYDTGLTTIYAIRFENFTTSEMFEVIEVMEHEFSGFVRSRDVEGTPVRATYG